METQHEFIERRLDGHRRAAIEAENDPLIKAFFGPHEKIAISERERRDYCLPPGWMLRRQAGDPLDAPVSSADTVLAVTESRVLGESSSHRRRNRRRRFVVRFLYGLRRAVFRLQQATARLTCPAP